MSYSRWARSCWYTFWGMTSSKIRSEQRFEICGVTSFTYEELTTDLQGCLYKIVGSEKEKEELKGYMLRFISDVESDPEIVPDFDKII